MSQNFATNLAKMLASSLGFDQAVNDATSQNINVTYDNEIDFDGASEAWNSNKRKLANGCYEYVCGAKLANGKKCCRKPGKDEWADNNWHCSQHVVEQIRSEVKDHIKTRSHSQVPVTSRYNLRSNASKVNDNNNPR